MNRRPAFSKALDKLTKNKNKPNKKFQKAKKFLEKKKPLCTICTFTKIMCFNQSINQHSQDST
jgi:hypothetical protein